MKRFKPLNSIKLTNLIVALTVLTCFVSVFAITYSLLRGALIDDIKDRAAGVSGYVHKVIDPECFIQINTAEDEELELYKQTGTLLNRTREVANLRDLYIVKKNESGQLVYIVGGLPAGFRHAGSSVENRAEDALRRCLDGGSVNGGDVFGAELGDVYIAYRPITHSGQVLGAIGMEFDISYILNSNQKAGVYSFLLSASLSLVFMLISKASLKRVSEPFYKKLAYQDYLTGLPNRMAFEEERKKYEESLDELTDFSYIIFDLNNLKTINDDMGHSVGDTYLRSSAEIISQAMKHLGKTYRIGGDEFATMVSGHSEDEINDALNGLSAGEKFVLKNQRFGCAYGLAVFDRGIDNNLNDVFVRADKKMYEDKRSGKEARRAPFTAKMP